MIDFRELTMGRIRQPLSPSLSKLVEEQSELWTTNEDSWVVIPIDEDSYEVIASSNEAMRRSLEALRSSLGPSEAPSLSSYVSVEVEGLGLMVAKLQPSVSRKNKTSSALDLLVKTRRALPRPIVHKDEALNSLLRDFFLSLSNLDKASAEEILDKIASNGKLRLDNQVYLRLQKDASFGQWAQISERGEFADLCRMRKPNLISSILLESLFHSLVTSKTDTSNPTDIVADLATATIPSHVVDLVNGISFPDRGVARRMLAVFLKLSNKFDRLNTLLSAVSSEEKEEILIWIGGLPSVQTRKESTGESLPEQTAGSKVDSKDYVGLVEMVINNVESFLLNAGEVLMALLEVDDLSLVLRCKKLIESINGIDDLNVGEKLMWTRVCSRVDSTCNGWPDWAERLSGDYWEEGLSAISDWRTWAMSWSMDSAVAEKFAGDLLVGSQNQNRPVLEVVIADLIEFLNIVAEMPGSKVLEPLRSALILIFVDLAPSSSAMREGSVSLLGNSISNGCSKKVYKELLDMIEGIWERHCSLRTINWISVVLAEIEESPCPDASLRDDLKIRIAASLSPYLNSISGIWRTELEATLRGHLIFPVSEDEDNFSDWRVLSGMKIGIYSTLDTVQELVSEMQNIGIDTRWRNDTVATRQLRQAFLQVDVLFVHTARASHMGTATFDKLAAEMRFVNLRSLAAVRRAVDSYALEIAAR